MKSIGITGGVGAGKSLILAYVESHYKCRILLADEVAHIVKEPGQLCYDSLVALLGQDVLDEKGFIHKQRMAEKIFADEQLLDAVNALIHPAVETYIMGEIAKEKELGELDYFFVEAALLIECGYEALLDELWYIYADEEVRRQRLRESRHYSDQKIDQIMMAQLSDEEFRLHTKHVIDNSGNPQDTYIQIDQLLRG